MACVSSHSCFFFNDTATTEIYTLSLHDALPILSGCTAPCRTRSRGAQVRSGSRSEEHTSELQSRGLSSYAVFCLKKRYVSLSQTLRSSSAIASLSLAGLTSC